MGQKVSSHGIGSSSKNSSKNNDGDASVPAIVAPPAAAAAATTTVAATATTTVAVAATPTAIDTTTTATDATTTATDATTTATDATTTATDATTTAIDETTTAVDVTTTATTATTTATIETTTAAAIDEIFFSINGVDNELKIQRLYENIRILNEAEIASLSSIDHDIELSDTLETTVSSKNTQTSSSKGSRSSKKRNNWAQRFNCSKPKLKNSNKNTSSSHTQPSPPLLVQQPVQQQQELQQSISPSSSLSSLSPISSPRPLYSPTPFFSPLTSPVFEHLLPPPTPSSSQPIEINNDYLPGIDYDVDDDDDEDNNVTRDFYRPPFMPRFLPDPCMCMHYQYSEQYGLGPIIQFNPNLGNRESRNFNEMFQRRNYNMGSIFATYRSVSPTDSYDDQELPSLGESRINLPHRPWNVRNEDIEEKAYKERAKEIQEGIEPPPGFKPRSQMELTEFNPPKLSIDNISSFFHKATISSSSPQGVMNNDSHKIHTSIDYIHYLVPDLLQITNCSFYWGKMDRYEAEKLLDNRSEGTFLLRDSAQEEYLFSVSFRKYGRSLHARIEQWNHMFSFDSRDPGVFASPTVCGLIEHYKDPSCCMFFEPMLTIPLHRNFTFSLQHTCRATICNKITYDDINQMKLPKVLKAYLKEYHYRQRVRVRFLDMEN